MSIVLTESFKTDNCAQFFKLHSNTYCLCRLEQGLFVSIRIGTKIEKKELSDLSKQTVEK